MRTNNLAEVKNGKPFTWGRVIKIHTIAEYSVIEYRPWKVNNGSILIGDIDLDKVEFSYYFNDISIGGTYSLDEAIASCIAYKYENDTEAARYFMKMIGAEDGEENDKN